MAGESLLITVGADISNADRKLDQLGRSVSDLDGHVGKSSKGLAGLAGGLGGLLGPATLAIGAFAGIGAGLVDSVGKAAKFDQSMASIRATMRPAGKEMDKLKDLALDLGAATDVGAVSASDAADAIFELGKAGISADAQLKGVTKATLQLAAAAGPEFGVGNAASLAADSLNMFGLSAEDATDVVNTLVGAANASSIGLSDLKFGLSAAGAVANTVGLSFEDTATALAALGAAGLKGSDAGTSLKSMLTGLIPATNKQKEAFQDLGFWTEEAGNHFFDAEGNVKGLSEIAGELQENLSHLTAEQRLSALETLFGADAMRAASILYEEGAEGVNEMATAMTAQGDAAKVAADMSNNLQGKWDALVGTVETLQIKIGGALMPVLSKLVDKLNTQVSGFLDWMGSSAGQAALDGFAESVGNVADKSLALIQLLISPDAASARNFFGECAASAEKFTNVMDDFSFPNLGAFLDSLNDESTGNGLSGFEEFFSGIENAATEFQTHWNTILQGVANAWNTVADALGLEKIVGPWEKATTEITNKMRVFATSMDTETVLMRDNVGLSFTQLKDKALAECVLLSDGASTKFKTMKDTVSEEGRLMQLGYIGHVTNLRANSVTEFQKLSDECLPKVQSFGEECVIAVQSMSDQIVGKSIIPDMVTAVGVEFGLMKDDSIAKMGAMALETVGKATALGTGIVSGIVSGLGGLVAALTGKLVSAINQAIANAKAALGIHSPSTVFADEIGVPIGWGIEIGLEKRLGEGKLGGIMIGGISAALSNAKEFVVGEAQNVGVHIGEGIVGGIGRGLADLGPTLARGVGAGMRGISIGDLGGVGAHGSIGIPGSVGGDMGLSRGGGQLVAPVIGRQQPTVLQVFLDSEEISQALGLGQRLSLPRTQRAGANN